MHTMIEASADLSGTELELSDVTSPPRHHQRGGAEQLQEEDKTHEVFLCDLLKFESESGSEAEEEEVFPPDSDPDPQCTLPTWRCCTPA